MKLLTSVIELDEGGDKCYRTRCSHVRFIWPDDQFKKQLTLAQRFEDEQSREVHRTSAIRAYLLYLVVITIFTDKSVTCVDVVYLKY